MSHDPIFRKSFERSYLKKLHVSFWHTYATIRPCLVVATCRLLERSSSDFLVCLSSTLRLEDSHGEQGQSGERHWPHVDSAVREQPACGPRGGRSSEMTFLVASPQCAASAASPWKWAPRTRCGIHRLRSPAAIWRARHMIFQPLAGALSSTTRYGR